MSNYDKIVSLTERLQSNQATANLRDALDHTIERLKNYGTRAEIAKILREAADDLEQYGQKVDPRGGEAH